MAYQNVGTPRFYINTLEWLMSIGMGENINMNNNPISILNTLPVNPTSVYAGIDTVAGLPINYSSKSFVAVLGHNIYSSSDAKSYALNDKDDHSNFANENIVNAWGESYDGFSIQLFNMDDESKFYFRIYKLDNSGNVVVGGTADIGSLIIGTYYDMPHSPDLNLTMTREYGGVKTIETKGGASLSNAFYTKPPKWGNNLGAWELLPANVSSPQDLSRTGRRVWDLSFSYLDDGDVFGSNQSVGALHDSGYYYPSAGGLSALGYDSDDISTSGDGDEFFTDNILTHDNFYSQVIHKTNGGQLPFIFQPDKDNNNPDQFAICKFDMNSFSYQQTAPNLYSMKLKIREVW